MKIIMSIAISCSLFGALNAYAGLSSSGSNGIKRIPYYGGGVSFKKNVNAQNVRGRKRFSQGFKKSVTVCRKWVDVGSSVKGAPPEEKCEHWVECQHKKAKAGEPLVVSCSCHIRHSTKHPDYDPHNEFRSWTSNGVNQDKNAAEEEARQGCTDEFDMQNKNPAFWMTSINCREKHRYTCEDGLVEYR